jgi:hypothetical protein
MDLAEALDRIDAIHGHLARGEPYRGYRPLALALSGVIGLLAAAAQPLFVADDPGSFIVYWVAVALTCGVVAGGTTVHGYLFRDDDLARRRTRVVLRQFVPCLFAGVVVTIVLSRQPWQPLAVPLLPGLWALLFGLGTVASLPYLPRAAALVAGWYLLAAVVLFCCDPAAPGGWGVGVPFGVGQLFAAAVLLRDRNTRAES